MLFRSARPVPRPGWPGQRHPGLGRRLPGRGGRQYARCLDVGSRNRRRRRNSKTQAACAATRFRAGTSAGLGLAPEARSRELIGQYQYYEFRAIDQSLTSQEMASFSAISSRARINSAPSDIPRAQTADRDDDCVLSAISPARLICSLSAPKRMHSLSKRKSRPKPSRTITRTLATRNSMANWKHHGTRPRTHRLVGGRASDCTFRGDRAQRLFGL